MKAILTENCPHCKRIFKGSVGSNKKHEYVCQKLYQNKESILEDYKMKVSSTKISKKYKIDVSIIRNLLKQNGYTNLDSRNTVDRNYFNKKTPEMFWLLGLIASDGNICNKNSWYISQSGDNGFQLIQYISKIINHSNKITTVSTKGKDAHSIRISSTEMVENLKKYKITERKTLSLEFDYSIFENNEEYFKSFLRGYIDGDGCVSISHQKKIRLLNISFVGNHNFIDSLIYYIPFNDFSKSKLENVTQISYSGESAVRFCDWLYSNNQLYKHYKYNHYLNYINSDDKVRWSIYNKLYSENKHRLLTEKPWHICQDIGVSCDLVIKWKNRTDTIIKAGNFYYSSH